MRMRSGQSGGWRRDRRTLWGLLEPVKPSRCHVGDRSRAHGIYHFLGLISPAALSPAWGELLQMRSVTLLSNMCHARSWRFA